MGQLVMHGRVECKHDAPSERDEKQALGLGAVWRCGLCGQELWLKLYRSSDWAGYDWVVNTRLGRFLG